MFTVTVLVQSFIKYEEHHRGIMLKDMPVDKKLKQLEI